MFGLGLKMFGSVDWVSVGFSFGPVDCLGLLVGGSEPKPMVPTMPPFSRLGRSFFSVGKREYLGLARCGDWREKRIFGTCLILGLVDR